MLDATETPRNETRQRLERLRARLALAGVDGFIVPHADEHQSEYLPASAERLAWLTGFTGSAGAAIVLRDKAAIFVDGRYTIQARSEVDADLFSHEHLIETPPSKWLAAHIQPRRPGRLRSLADDGRRSSPLRRGVQGRRGRAGRACRESARRGLDGSPAAAGRSRVAPPGGARRRRGRGEDRPPAGRSRREAGRCGGARPGRLRSPGPSTSAAPISPTIRRRSPSPSCAPAASRRCSSTGGNSPTPSGLRSPISPTSTSSTALAKALMSLGDAKAKVLLDPQSTAGGDSPGDRAMPAARSSRGTTRPSCPRPGRTPTELAGDPRRAYPRRRRHGAFPRLARRRAGRHHRRDRGGREARRVPRRYGARATAPSSPTSRSTRSRAPGRTAPSCITGSRPATARRLETGLALSGRFRRAIPRRHDRHHAHRRHRHADGGNARALHARAQGPHRDRHRALSGRCDRRAARFARPDRAVAGGARLRPRHRPRRRLVSRRCTRGRRAFRSSARRRSSRG